MKLPKKAKIAIYVIVGISLLCLAYICTVTIIGRGHGNISGLFYNNKKLEEYLNNADIRYNYSKLSYKDCFAKAENSGVFFTITLLDIKKLKVLNAGDKVGAIELPCLESKNEGYCGWIRSRWDQNSFRLWRLKIGFDKNKTEEVKYNLTKYIQYCYWHGEY